MEEKKRKILIVSELFYPMNRIGAVRPTKLAKYLNMRGYEVTVFTSNECLLNDNCLPILPYSVIYARKTKPQVTDRKNTENDKHVDNRKGKIGHNKIIYNVLQEMRMTKRQYYSYKKGKEFCQLFCEYIDSGKLKIEDYECVFSTFGPIGSMLSGMEAKRRNPSLIWINDFRDPMVSQIMPKIFVPYYGHLQKKSINAADYTVTVSEGYRKRMGFRAMKGNIIVIPNGFDKDDLVIDGSNDKSFSFAYVGTLYEGKRDVSILFKCLQGLIEKNILSLDQISFHYAGYEGNVLKAQAQKYGLEQTVYDHGLVSREESIRIQSSVRFLVLSTWNDKGEEGVFPGKLIEYMLMDKPVVSIVGGALNNSEVTQVINNMRLGISCENADKNSEKKLYKWINKQALQFAEGKPAIFNPDRDTISKTYDWEHIVERFCEIING